MKISIVGTGYVGLVSGVCLAEVGHTVTCVDTDAAKVRAIQKGISPIYEAGLTELLVKNIKEGRFCAGTDLAEAVRNTDITLIAVGTPSAKSGRIDLSYVKNAAQQIGEMLKEKKSYHVVVVKSTVVPTTTDTVIQKVLERASGKKAGVDFGLCMNPEFLREGSAVKDFLYPDRVVIGSTDKRAGDTYARAYKSFACPVVHTNTRTAEMVKYTANAFLATLISYANEMANISEEVGDIDIEEVLRGVHLDGRFMPSRDQKNQHIKNRITPGFLNYLRAGCGYGGSCFPKDVSAFAAFAAGLGYAPRMLESTIGINSDRPGQLARALEAQLGNLKNKRVAVWGIAFKPDTDDVRSSPAEGVVNYLVHRGAHVVCVDPVALKNARTLFAQHKTIAYSKSAASSAKDAHAVVVLTPWNEFRGVDFGKLARTMKKNAVVADGRRMFDRNDVEQAGLRYIGVGYKPL